MPPLRTGTWTRGDAASDTRALPTSRQDVVSGSSPDPASLPGRCTDVRVAQRRSSARPEWSYERPPHTSGLFRRCWPVSQEARKTSEPASSVTCCNEGRCRPTGVRTTACRRARSKVAGEGSGPLRECSSPAGPPEVVGPSSGSDAPQLAVCSGDEGTEVFDEGGVGEEDATRMGAAGCGQRVYPGHEISDVGGDEHRPSEMASPGTPSSSRPSGFLRRLDGTDVADEVPPSTPYRLPERWASRRGRIDARWDGCPGWDSAHASAPGTHRSPRFSRLSRSGGLRSRRGRRRGGKAPTKTAGEIRYVAVRSEQPEYTAFRKNGQQCPLLRKAALQFSRRTPRSSPSPRPGSRRGTLA